MANSVSSPIRECLETQRAESIEAAEKEARELVDRLKAELAEKNGQIADCYITYPKTKEEQDAVLETERFRKYRKLGLVSYDAEATKKHESDLYKKHGAVAYKMMDSRKVCVKITEEGVEKFVKLCRDDADLRYEKFVVKMEGKAGEVKTAEIDGNHIWGYSHLTVETEDGEKQIWRTQMIVNYSSKGTPFNQFPSRKVKKR